MSAIRKQVGPWTLRANCVDGLKSSAEWLLNVVASFADQGKGLNAGVIIQIGWTLVRLQQDGKELAVCEPDYDGNPFANFRDDVSCTLNVLARQNLLHEQLGIDQTKVRYDEKIVLRKGCLAGTRMYAQRQSPRENDSGWYIGPANGPSEPAGAEELEAMYVYQLLSARPRLLDIVALPEDFLVVFDGDRIEAVLDPNNNNLLSSEQ